MAHLPPDDPVVYKMLQEADTIGVFQVESRAQMATLPRLHPEKFYDLVVQVAIIRPGPIVGQMVHPFLNRRAGREPVTYPHPLLEPILARTLGVPLFQEQLLRMAMVTAGFSGGQAEELRRAFGFKRSERRMKQVEVKLREGMAQQGITGEVAEQIISSITAFALYGFPESHAASFALLAYASAYLKAHFPAAFYTALLNNQPMGFYHPATLVKDAQRRGVRFTGVDVQHSDWLCRVDADGSVRLGLRYVSGLREEVGKAIERAGIRDSGLGIRSVTRADRIPTFVRNAGVTTNRCSRRCAQGRISATTARTTGRTPQPYATQRTPRIPRFTSVDDLVTRTGIRRDELQMLADIGAFASFGYERREASGRWKKLCGPLGSCFRTESPNRPESRNPWNSVPCRQCPRKRDWWPTMPARI